MFGWFKKALGMNTKEIIPVVYTEDKPIVKTPEEIARIRARNLEMLKQVHARMITEGKLPKYA